MSSRHLGRIGLKFQSEFKNEDPNLGIISTEVTDQGAMHLECIYRIKEVGSVWIPRKKILFKDGGEDFQEEQ